MPPYRIVLLFEYATLNGGECSMLAALDWLQTNDTRFEFIAVAPTTGRLADALRAREITVYDHPLKSSDHRPPGDNDQLLREIIESCKPDLLHANSLSMGRRSGRIASSLKIPVTSHLRDIIKLSRAAISDLNDNTCLIAVSHATRAFHVAQGITGERCRVVHNGLDLNQFQPRPPTGRLRDELGLSFEGHSDPILIATIGQIGLRKGQDVLAAAAPLIVDKVPQAHFLIIGERSSQKLESVEFEQALNDQFAKSGLIDHLHLLGNRDDIPEILNEIQLVVHPANQEPFGRVLLEAASSGVPVVATDVGGTSEIITHNETGLLVPPRDPEALAHAVIDLLTVPGKADRFRQKARERAVRNFSIGNSARHLADVWMELFERRKHGLTQSPVQASS